VADELRERKLAWEILRDSPTFRLAGAMGGPWWRSKTDDVETDENDLGPGGMTSAAPQYFARRSEEELEAARNASCNSSRIAHEELAKLFAQLAFGNAQVGSSH
jgi:hypothetical protein